MTNYVRSKVPVDELLAMLAEEAVEVAHAALKLRRVYNGINPTPVSEDEATEKFYEELADFTLVTRVIGVNPEYIAKLGEQKLARWVSRLQDKVGGTE